MSSVQLRFDARGLAVCLHTELIDLTGLGRLSVLRATDLRFQPGTQQWEVPCSHSGGLLYSNPSRQACLNWEQHHLQVGRSAASPGAEPPAACSTSVTGPNKPLTDIRLISPGSNVPTFTG